MEEEGEEEGGTGTEEHGAGGGKESVRRSNFPSWLRLTDPLEVKALQTPLSLTKGSCQTLRFCKVPFLRRDKIPALCKKRKPK